MPKPEVLRKMDERVAIQRKHAYLLADRLGCSFFPSQGPKRTILGYLAFKGGVSHRLELKVRDFDRWHFDTSLIETKLMERIGADGLWYAECFSDGHCILYRGLGSIVSSNFISTTEVAMNSVTVSSKSKKMSKSVISVPYSLGEMLDLSARQASNTIHTSLF